MAERSSTRERKVLEKNEEALVKAAQMDWDDEDLPGPATSAAALLALDFDESEVTELGKRTADKLIREKEERDHTNPLVIAQAEFRHKVAASQEEQERLQAEHEENAEKRADAQKKADADAEKKRQSESR